MLKSYKYKTTGLNQEKQILGEYMISAVKKLLRLTATKAERYIKELETVQDTIDMSMKDLLANEVDIKKKLVKVKTDREKLKSKKESFKGNTDVEADIDDTLEIVLSAEKELEEQVDEIVKARETLEQNKVIIIARLDCYEMTSSIYSDKIYKNKSNPSKDLKVELNNIKEKLDEIKAKNVALKEVAKKYNK